MNKFANHYVLTVFMIVIAAACVLVFRANRGIDYADARLYVLQQANVTELSDNVIQAVKQLPNIARVELIGSDKIYAYFQDATDNVILANVQKVEQSYPVTTVGVYNYKYAMGLDNYLVNSAIEWGIIFFGLGIIYYALELRGLGWKRWQVLSYIVSDVFMTAASIIVLLGTASLVGQLGMKMDDDFVALMGLGVGITAIFQLFEIEIIKRAVLNVGNKVNFDDAEGVFVRRKPELILLSCVLTLIGFMPLLVVFGRLSVLSVIVFMAIAVNYYLAVNVKPGLFGFLLRQGTRAGLSSSRIFQKVW